MSTSVDPALLSVDLPHGAIDMMVTLGLDAAEGGRRQQLQVRAVLDGTGALSHWACGGVDRPPTHDLEPCLP